MLLDITSLLALTRRPHGSLKPQNIFIDQNGSKRIISLADFDIDIVKAFIGSKDEKIGCKIAELQSSDPYSHIPGAKLDRVERDCYALGKIDFELIGCDGITHWRPFFFRLRRLTHR